MSVTDDVPGQRDDARDLLRALQRRRSFGIKELLPDPVPRADLERMLEAANWSPSHGKTEPWRFAVFTGDARLQLGERFAEAYRLVTAPDKRDAAAERSQRDRATIAPAWISIGMTPATNLDGSPKMPEWEEMIATGIAAQHLHLMASALGYAAKWTSGEPARHPIVAELCGLPPTSKLLGFYYVGKPSTAWPAGTRKPIADKVRWMNGA